MKEHVTNSTMARHGNKQKMQMNTPNRNKQQQSRTHFQNKQQ